MTLKFKTREKINLTFVTFAINYIKYKTQTD